MTLPNNGELPESLIPDTTPKRKQPSGTMDVRLAWDAEELSEGWMNEGNLESLLYSSQSTGRDLLSYEIIVLPPPGPDAVDDAVTGQMLLAQKTGKWMAIVVRLEETDAYVPIVYRKTNDFPRAMIPAVIERITAALQKEVPGPPVVELAEASPVPMNRLGDLGLGE